MGSLMALLGLIGSWWALGLVTAIGLVATLLESLIGATLQRRWSWMSNELVNGLQTLIAALLALGMAGLLQGLQP